MLNSATLFFPSKLIIHHSTFVIPLLPHDCIVWRSFHVIESCGSGASVIANELQGSEAILGFHVIESRGSGAIESRGSGVLQIPIRS
jgi:hypothetical protein